MNAGLAFGEKRVFTLVEINNSNDQDGKDNDSKGTDIQLFIKSDSCHFLLLV